MLLQTDAVIKIKNMTYTTIATHTATPAAGKSAVHSHAIPNGKPAKSAVICSELNALKNSTISLLFVETILRNCQIVSITNDSSSLHLAALLG